MKEHLFNEGDYVTVHSLGPSHGDQEYPGIIRGIAVDYGNNPATIYIVAIKPSIDQDYKYSHCTIPQACLRRTCCERDNDGDGNCDIHSAPGVLRKPL